MKNRQVWFVTGASQGLGLALVKSLLQGGYAVAATSRDAQGLRTVIGDPSEAFLPLEVSLTEEQSVQSAIEQTIVHFGHIDVVVNNAGYGQLGTLEELTDREARANFEVNVFGALHVIRNVMPYLRQQRSGKLFNISSIGGLFGSFPGWGIYCATKFAMAGFTEALAEEVKAFGITATVIYPGYFRTNFLSKGSVRSAQQAIPEYETARQSEQAHFDSIHGNQPNDPDKAAEAIIALAKEENPPVHLLLGVDTIDMLNAKLERLDSDVKAWESYTLSTGFSS